MIKQFNRLLGGTLIVSGTTIGAAFIALPITSALAGFTNSIFLLLGMGALTCFTGLLTLEVNIYFKKGISVAGFSESLFGKTGKYIATLALLLLFYALLAAYIAGGSSIINSILNLNSSTELTSKFTPYLFTLVLGGLIFACTHAVDYGNRILFTAKMVAFVVLLGILIPRVNIQNLFLQTNIQTSTLWIAIPIFFTSFGFHGSIPSIVNYVGNKPKHLRWVFIIGSILPLFLYLTWQVVTLGVLPLKGPISFEQVFTNKGDVAAFINQLNHIADNSSIFLISNLFTSLAIATSFLGVGIGLFDFLAELLNIPNTTSGRTKTTFLTFSLPLLFAVAYPTGFIRALGLAAIALSVLAIIMPVLAAWKIRLKHASSQYKVTGGTLSLALALLAGLTIIVIEVKNLCF